jgi:hypothetical protein
MTNVAPVLREANAMIARLRRRERRDSRIKGRPIT